MKGSPYQVHVSDRSHQSAARRVHLNSAGDTVVEMHLRAPDEQRLISGSIRAKGGEPLGGAQVKIIAVTNKPDDPSSAGSVSVVGMQNADEDGMFSFWSRIQNVDRYYVVGEHDGFPVVLEPWQPAVSGVDPRLELTASELVDVEGIVRFADGIPAANAWVNFQWSSVPSYVNYTKRADKDGKVGWKVPASYSFQAEGLINVQIGPDGDTPLFYSLQSLDPLREPIFALWLTRYPTD